MIIILLVYLAPGLWFLNRTLPGNIKLRQAQGTYEPVQFFVLAVLTLLTWPRHLYAMLLMVPAALPFLSGPLSFWRGRWGIIPDKDRIHVFPFGDSRRHLRHDCPCNPQEEGHGTPVTMVSHNAWDGRK